MPVPLSALRSAAQPPITNVRSTMRFCAGASMITCGPTRLLPCGFRTIRTFRRLRALQNTKWYVPTNPTLGCQVKAPVDGSKCEPIGKGSSLPDAHSALRRSREKLDTIHLLGLDRH